jgi:hypothetical protein
VTLEPSLGASRRGNGIQRVDLFPHCGQIAVFEGNDKAPIVMLAQLEKALVGIKCERLNPIHACRGLTPIVLGHPAYGQQLAARDFNIQSLELINSSAISRHKHYHDRFSRPAGLACDRHICYVFSTL